jgi:hypothetical protein
LRLAPPGILASYSNILSPRRFVSWTIWLTIAAVSAEIEALAVQEESCQILMSVPGVVGGRPSLTAATIGVTIPRYFETHTGHPGGVNVAPAVEHLLTFG